MVLNRPNKMRRPINMFLCSTPTLLDMCQANIPVFFNQLHSCQMPHSFVNKQNETYQYHILL